MLEGLYAAAAGMVAQRDRMDVVSNDIANVNTTGYRRTRVAFRDLVYTEAGLAASPTVRDGSGAATTLMGRVTSQGPLLNSENPMDVAITGPGYLAVRNDRGELRLTRDGHLQIDARSRIVTPAGNLLDPPVQLPPGTAAKDVTIRPDGTVQVAGREVGALRLVNVPAEAGLQAVGDNLYAPTAASGAVRRAAGTEVMAGKLEGSNADLADSMTQMIEAQRAFELASKAIQTQDRIHEIAVQVKRF